MTRSSKRMGEQVVKETKLYLNITKEEHYVKRIFGLDSECIFLRRIQTEALEFDRNGTVSQKS